jgi:hypothetical protein
MIEFETKENDEQITGLAIGLVTSPKQPEIVYTCYSGSVKSVCDRKVAKKLGVAVDDAA